MVKKRKKASKETGETGAETKGENAAPAKGKKRKAGVEGAETAVSSKPEVAPMKAKKQKTGIEGAETTASSKPEVAPPMKAKKQKPGIEGAETTASSKPEVAPMKAKKQKTGIEGAETTASSKPEVAPMKAKKLKTGVEEAETAASSKPQAKGKESSPGDDLTVFVDGVPYDWTLDRIKEFFTTKAGTVEDVRAPTWQDTGRLRGFAHVAFATADGKAKGLKLNGTKVGKKGRFLKIEPAKRPSEGKTLTTDIEGKRRLFVKNLPYDASEDDIAKVFAKCGKVVEIRIPHASGRSKGFAYVEFAKAQGLKAAMELDPPPSLQGRKLQLDADSGTGPKAGFHHRPDAFQSNFVSKNNKGKGKGKGRGRLSLF